MSTKKQYQLYPLPDHPISFDNIAEEITKLAIPCSQVFELTDEEYVLDRAYLQGTWFKSYQIMCLTDRYVAVEDIEAERIKRDEYEAKARKTKIMAAEAKKAAKLQAFQDQCDGKSGKVKRS